MTRQRYLFAAAAITLMVCCCGCAGRLPQGALTPVAAATPDGTTRIPILVATTRKRSVANAGDMFGGERAEQMSYAAITVSIPPEGARTIGRIQWPTSAPGDPGRDFVTVSADYLDRPALFSAAISSNAKATGRNKVLVFVHGYNNRFDEAVFRLAQIVQDSKAPVIPVLFSWPSRGLVQLGAYTDDVESANDSRNALLQLLGTIALNRDVKEVTVLCHSMGCWPALEALQPKDKVKNVLLVAPDVDIDAFHKEIRQSANAKRRIALFVSQDDQALKLSKLVWGGKARLGDIDPATEPYRSDFAREGILVFDLTTLSGNAHSRAFEDVTSVMGMIEERFAEGQQMTVADSELGNASP